ncbi:hypothetical protein LX36DRAFT_251317 [Colletotrichum falcatum]|nr:hypothetical protein LX36DRAFT_251317 [Colletotrichum falcatum]
MSLPSWPWPISTRCPRDLGERGPVSPEMLFPAESFNLVLTSLCAGGYLGDVFLFHAGVSLAWRRTNIPLARLSCLS